MLRKLRRNSKERVDVASTRCREDSAVTVPSESTSDETKLTFFDLPAELRNAIYEFVISDAVLTLPCAISTTSRRSKLLLKKRKAALAPINGLLLASRQCRREYLAALLSSVSVVVEIKDFEFESLIRVSCSLDELELEALQSNRNLVLQLNTQNCTVKDLASLRRWLDYRRMDEANLTWKYEFPLDRLLPQTTMGRVRLLRELEYYADSISTLLVDAEGEQQTELQSIIEAFQSKALWLEDNLGWLGQRQKSMPRNLRGLAGGGLL